MTATCSHARCLCVPTEPLVILGIDASGNDIWFAREDEVFASFPELAQLRRSVASQMSGGMVDHYGTRLDESDVSALVKAMEEHVSGERLLPLYPLQICRTCGLDAVALIEGTWLCRGHVEGYGRREDEATA